jgi:hypothetical protein
LFSTGYVWSFVICTGQGVELTRQFVTSDTNKTAAAAIRVMEHILDRSHIMNIFYNSPDFTCFLKSEETDCYVVIKTFKTLDVPLFSDMFWYDYTILRPTFACYAN